jgi:hypothetical protein
MASFIYKWLLLVVCMLPMAAFHHPIHVTVIEIEHIESSSALEISCKIDTDDFEKALKKRFNTKIDLLNPSTVQQMDEQVKQYILEKFQVKINDSLISLNYLSFEQDDDAIVALFQSSNITNVKKAEIKNSLLYELYTKQMGIIHVLVNAKRKSTKLNNPVDKVTFQF